MEKYELRRLEIGEWQEYKKIDWSPYFLHLRFLVATIKKKQGTVMQNGWLCLIIPNVRCSVCIAKEYWSG